MTQNQAAKAMRELVGTKKFNLETSQYYNPRKTRHHIFTNYNYEHPQSGCVCGSGASWQEAIDDLKKELGE